MYIFIVVTLFIAIMVIAAFQNASKKKNDDQKNSFFFGNGEDDDEDDILDSKTREYNKTHFVKKEDIKESEKEPKQEEPIPDSEPVQEIIPEEVKPVEPEPVYNQMPFYVLCDYNKLELNKFLAKNNKTIIPSNLDFETESLDYDNFSGCLKKNNNVLLFELHLKNPLDSSLTSFYFKESDDISISILYYKENNLIDFALKKVSSSSFSKEETGNYLFTYPDLLVQNFGFCQFSYYNASELLKIILKDISPIINN